MKRIAIIPVALVALAACSTTQPIETVYVTVPADAEAEAEAENASVTDEEIELLALEMTWDQKKGEVCPIIEDLGGLTPALIEMGVASFEEGYEKPLSPAMEARIIELMEAC